MLISHTASGRTHGRGGCKMLVIDARKAHLHAMAGREVYVDLPAEQSVPGMCARLNRCFYGTVMPRQDGKHFWLINSPTWA